MRIIKDYIPVGNRNRSGILIKKVKYLNIHETGNFSFGADAKMHSIYIKSAGASAREVSWTWSVDSKETVYQHLPDSPAEVGWQAGDGWGSGNMECLSIEMCVNIDGDYEQTLKNTIWLARDIFKTHPDLKIRIIKDSIKQHNFWSGKDCPQRLRASGKWNWFVDECTKLSDTEVIDMGISKGDKVFIKTTATNYATGEPIVDKYKMVPYTVQETMVGKALMEEITSWVYLKDLQLVNPPVVVPVVKVPKADYDRVVSQLKASNSKYANFQISAEKYRVAYEKTILDLKADIALLKKAEIIYKSNIATAEKDKQKLFTEIAGYLKELDSSDKTVAGLKATGKIKTDEIRTLQTEISDLNLEVLNITDELEFAKAVHGQEIETAKKSAVDWKETTPGEMIIHAIRLILRIKD